MGERADGITPYSEGTYDSSDVDSYAMSDDSDQSTEAIRADIDSTRTEMGQTINAIQEKLNPQQLMDQAKNTVVETASQVIDKAKDSVTETVDHVTGSTKEAAVEAVDHAKQTVHDATVGKVEHMVTNISDTAQETGSGIMETIKKNPIPAALVGLGLGWIFMKGQNKPAGNSSMRYPQAGGYPASAYGYSSQIGNTGQYPRYPSGSSQSSSSEGIANRLMSSVRQNPVPAALTGLGLGYMVMQGQNSGKQSGSYSNYDSRYQQQGIGQRVGNVAGQAGDKVGEIASSVGDTASNVAEKAGDVAADVIGGVTNTIGGAASGVGDVVGGVAGGVSGAIGGVAGGVGDAVGGVATGVQYQAQQAQTQFERMLEDRPLVVGAVALALGAAVGLMLPNTPQENVIMGEAHDTFVEKAQEVAQQTFEKVQHVGEEVSNTAKDAVQNIASTAKEEAQNQGLTQ